MIGPPKEPSKSSIFAIGAALTTLAAWLTGGAIVGMLGSAPYDTSSFIASRSVARAGSASRAPSANRSRWIWTSASLMSATLTGIRLREMRINAENFAAIQTLGLLGGKYIGLSPGGNDQYLKSGSVIEQTQSAIVLESLINKFFANYTNKGSGDSSAAPADTQSKAESKK